MYFTLDLKSSLSIIFKIDIQYVHLSYVYGNFRYSIGSYNTISMHLREIDN